MPDMTTAPKDGTRILAYDRAYGHYVCQWAKPTTMSLGEWVIMTPMGYTQNVRRPEQWWPLPEPA